MLDTLRDLCLINGTSGDESKVRNYIIDRIKDRCEYRVDPMGNILAHKKGASAAKNKVMVSAHMDEVGFIITNICENGFLKFSPVGGVDSRVVLGRKLTVGEKGISGIVGAKAVHLTEGDESGKVPGFDKLYIDIGAESREEALKWVSVGDTAYFASDYLEFGDGKIKAKAIDDRFGCAVMIKLIESELAFDCDFAFLVQEEVGCRGAGPAVFSLRPDFAVVLEATTAGDIAGVSAEDSVCMQEKGAVVSFMDRACVYNRELYKGAFALAEKKGIAIQTKTAVAGGNDAGTIVKSGPGVKAIAVSLPCRYIHSGTCVADKKDMDACLSLAKALTEEYADA